MTGFKNFLLRGNLVEIAVAFVIAAAFKTVVDATVALILGIVGKAGGYPDFTSYKPGGLLVGVWLTAIIAFVIVAAVVYYLIVKPYMAAKERYFPEEPEGVPADVALLEDIRDLLRQQQGGTAPPTL